MLPLFFLFHCCLVNIHIFDYRTLSYLDYLPKSHRVWIFKVRLFSGQSQRMQKKVYWPNQNWKSNYCNIHCSWVSKSRSVILLIGWESGTFFFNQSLSVVMKNQVNASFFQHSFWQVKVTLYGKKSITRNLFYMFQNMDLLTAGWGGIFNKLTFILPCWCAK